VDLPPWARSWKRGLRGVRLYYLLWQAAAVHRARAMDRTLSFDLAWHLTLANAWLGSLGPLIDRPFIYGPVGGGAKTPRSLLPVLGVQGIAYEAVRNLARFLGRYVNPLARVAWHRAALILVQNEETRTWLPKRHRSKAEVFPNVVLEELPPAVPPDREGAARTALFAGRLLAWKGGALAIQTIARLPGWRLVMIGSGPDEARLRRMVSRAGLGDRVVFVPPMAREELLRRLCEEADVFLFPSLHDEAGWVVAEAASQGLPVVCLHVGGPPLLGGNAVPPSTPARTALVLASAVTNATATRLASTLDFTLATRAVQLKDLLALRDDSASLQGRASP
jgi:glycosyltransferase involved in cell wall biosynthesis